MPNANYLAGRRFEWERVAAWKKLGYKASRSAGSHGPWDVVAARDDRGVVLIQCKYVDTQAEAEAEIRQWKRDTRPIKGAQKRIEVRVRGSSDVQSWSV